jgi:hypothetical protein
MRRSWFLTSLGSLALLPAVPTAIALASPASRTIDDIGPLLDYLRASRTFEDVVEPARFLRFRSEIVPRSFAAHGGEFGAGSSRFLKGWLAQIYPIRAQMTDLRDDLLATLSVNRAVFERRFPDRLPEYTNYLSASGLLFDAVAFSRSEYRLIFGVDKLALDAISAEHLALVAHHEMFHLLHSAASREFATGLLQKSVAEALWFEGLACYASSLLHPNASLAQIVGMPNAKRPNARTLQQVQPVLRARRSADVARLFGIDDAHDSTAPLGAGYVVGYELLRRYCERKRVDPAEAALTPASEVAAILAEDLSGLSRELA